MVTKFCMGRLLSEEKVPLSYNFIPPSNTYFTIFYPFYSAAAVNTPSLKYEYSTKTVCFLNFFKAIKHYASVKPLGHF